MILTLVLSDRFEIAVGFNASGFHNPAKPRLFWLVNFYYSGLSLGLVAA